jgi:dihydroorotase
VNAPTLLLRGGTVIDETGERAADVLVRDGVIAEVGPDLDAAGAAVLDAEGAVVAPGLVDIQVHFREPGREEAETIETGARAAALGGFTAVVAMPNTTPPLDDAKVVDAVLAQGRKVSCLVTVAGCITAGRAGGSSPRSVSSTTSACACSPTTATAWPTPT